MGLLYLYLYFFTFVTKCVEIRTNLHCCFMLKTFRGKDLVFGSCIRVEDNKNPQHVGGHGCLSVVIVVCCQVEVSATN